MIADLDVTVWFSEVDVPLGTSLIRKIDQGLAKLERAARPRHPGAVLKPKQRRIAAQELSALLATDRVIPIVHGTRFEELRRHSPLLAARSGLDTADYTSLEEVAAKVADTVVVD